MKTLIDKNEVIKAIEECSKNTGWEHRETGDPQRVCDTDFVLSHINAIPVVTYDSHICIECRVDKYFTEILEILKKYERLC